MATTYPTHPERIRRERRKHDAYYSASWMTRALLEHVVLTPQTSPCLNRAVVMALSPWHLRHVMVSIVITNDINPIVDANYNHDYLESGWLYG